MTRGDLHRAITGVPDGIVPPALPDAAVTALADIAVTWCAAQMAMAVVPDGRRR